MAFGNFVFEAASSETGSLLLERAVKGYELCESDAVWAALCGSCPAVIRRLAAIHHAEVDHDQSEPFIGTNH
jgi:hypothetical protein